MSLFDSQAEEVEVVAEAVYPAEEIYVLDQSLNEVARSVGSLKARLKPGIYKIRSIAGRVSAEEIFEVYDTPFPLNAPKPYVEVSSPIFLSSGQASSDPGCVLATNLSMNISLQNQVGQGGELLLVVRMKDGSRVLLTTEAILELKLCDAFGSEVRNLGEVMIVSVDGATAACSLALNPGSYLLRLERGRQPWIEQTIVIAAQWQTQIFVMAQPRAGSPTKLDLDLSDAGILMARCGEGFRSDRPESPWSEVSRQALADRRYSCVPLAELREAVGHAQTACNSSSGFVDPMFVLYAAHLLAQSPNPDEGLLREAADCLRRMIGDHPDVMVLYLWLGPSAELRAFSQAPMLRSSWNILMDRGDKLVLPGSYASRIADRLWSAGAWLTWRVPAKLMRSAPPAAPVELNALATLVMRNAGAVADFTKAAEVLQKQSLPSSERQLLGYLHNVASSSASAADLAREGSDVGGLRGLFLILITNLMARWINREARTAAKSILDPGSIARTLGMPEAVLAQAIGGLFTKFSEKDLLSIERRGARTSADVLAEEFIALHPNGQLQDETLPGVYRSIAALEHPQAALCLAGDGLRGAFFGLGILQGLARYKLLHQFHYLSTVSGGSYIGAWLTAWRHHAEDDNIVLSALASQAHGPSESADRYPVAGLVNTDDVGANRRGFLSLGVWTQYGRHARNLLLTWLVYGPLFLSVLMIPKAYLAFATFYWGSGLVAAWAAFVMAMFLLLAALTRRELDKIKRVGSSDQRASHDVNESLLLLSLGGASLCVATRGWLISDWATLLAGAAAVGAFQSGVSTILARAATQHGAPPLAFWRWSCAMIAGGAGGLVFAATFRELADVFYQQPEAGPAFVVAGVGLTFVTLILVDIVYLGLTSHLPGGERDRAWQAASIGCLSLALVAWVIFAWLDLFGPAAVASSGYGVVTITGISGAVGGVSGALALALGFGSLGVSRWRKLIGTASIYVAEVAAAALLAALVVILSANIDAVVDKIASLISDNESITASVKLTATLLLTIIFFILAVVTACGIDLSRFSPHEVQRGKSVRRFLGAAAANASRTLNKSPSLNEHDLPMSSVWRSERPPDNRWLFPVLNMSFDHFGENNHQRGETFTVTPLSSGSAVLGYRSSNDYCASDGGISLGTAMVLSGAAVDREIVRHTTPLVAFTLTLLGARQGLWLGNPRSDAASRRTRPRLSFAPTLEELLGSAPGDYIHVSSGDRFDPLGLYEMIRRRCRFIVISDSGADSLEHLGNVIRRVRLDFGVVIDMRYLELQPTQPASMGACCAMGHIRYPEDREFSGILIYLRPDLDGTEPLDIRSYAAQHSSSFPRERIAGHRFDAEAAESYRALGSHIVDTLCQHGHQINIASENFSLPELEQRVRDYLSARRAQRMANERPPG